MSTKLTRIEGKGWRMAKAILARLCSVLVFLGLACGADGGIYDFSFQMPGSGVVIPDGNPSGFQNTVNLGNIMPSQIQSVTLTINVSGGFNGDLYAYVSHGSGFSVLLNQVGTSSSDPFGYGNTGFHVTFSDAAAHDIHNYQSYSYTLDNMTGQLLGNWKPDNTDGNGSLSAFNGLDPNGDWTIFFADLSSGGQSTLLSWSLEIDAVPEPVTCALGIFLGIFASVGVVKFAKGRRARDQRSY